MCGRYTLSQTAPALASAFDVQQVADLVAQHNIAPTQLVATLVYSPKSAKREFQSRLYHPYQPGELSRKSVKLT